MSEEIISSFLKNVQDQYESFKEKLSYVSTRAINGKMFEDIKVIDQNRKLVELKKIAKITNIDGDTLEIQLKQSSLQATVVSSLEESLAGFNISPQGNKIICIFEGITSSVKVKFQKIINKHKEDCLRNIRDIRRNTLKSVSRLKSENDRKLQEKEIEKIMLKIQKEIDNLHDQKISKFK